MDNIPRILDMLALFEHVEALLFFSPMYYTW